MRTAIFLAGLGAVAVAAQLTETIHSTLTSTIISCGSEHPDCPSKTTTSQVSDVTSQVVLTTSVTQVTVETPCETSTPALVVPVVPSSAPSVPATVQSPAPPAVPATTLETSAVFTSASTPCPSSSSETVGVVSSLPSAPAPPATVVPSTPGPAYPINNATVPDVPTSIMIATGTPAIATSVTVVNPTVPGTTSKTATPSIVSNGVDRVLAPGAILSLLAVVACLLG